MSTQAEDSAKATLINPFNAMSFTDYVFKQRKPALAKEDWVFTNAALIKDIGPEAWLKQLVASLTIKPSKPIDNLNELVVSPHQVITVSGQLRGEHKPPIAIETWIAANVKLMTELGAEDWLWQLLNVLETGSSTTL